MLKIAAPLFAALLAATLVVAAQPTTGAQFYAEYRAAFAKAKGFNDIAPLMSKAQREKLASIPADQQKTLWALSKQMDVRDLKVVKETPTVNGATLEITAIGLNDTEVKGTVKLVKEGGAWKWDGEEVM
jgi:hypothetical protein